MRRLCVQGGLDIVIGLLVHLDAALYVLWLIDAKSYGAHHLDIVIGHLEPLDAALYALWLTDAKSYGAHHLDLVIGYLEQVDFSDHLV